jgi:hypothetical protein
MYNNAFRRHKVEDNSDIDNDSDINDTDLDKTFVGNRNRDHSSSRNITRSGRRRKNTTTSTHDELGITTVGNRLPTFTHITHKDIEQNSYQMKLVLREVNNQLYDDTTFFVVSNKQQQQQQQQQQLPKFKSNEINTGSVELGRGEFGIVFAVTSFDISCSCPNCVFKQQRQHIGDDSDTGTTAGDIPTKSIQIPITSKVIPLKRTSIVSEEAEEETNIMFQQMAGTPIISKNANPIFRNNNKNNSIVEDEEEEDQSETSSAIINTMNTTTFEEEDDDDDDDDDLDDYDDREYYDDDIDDDDISTLSMDRSISNKNKNSIGSNTTRTTATIDNNNHNNNHNHNNTSTSTSTNTSTNTVGHHHHGVVRDDPYTKCFMKRRCIRDGRSRYAVKRIRDNFLDHDNYSTTYNAIIDLVVELKFLENIKHPNVIRVRGTVDEPGSNNFCIIMDCQHYVNGLINNGIIQLIIIIIII